MRISPLILRCYATRDQERLGRWYAHCIDLDLSAGGETLEQARDSLSEAIMGYVEAVFDTKDKDSIPELLRRRAPAWEVTRWKIEQH